MKKAVYSIVDSFFTAITLLCVAKPQDQYHSAVISGIGRNSFASHLIALPMTARHLAKSLTPHMHFIRMEQLQLYPE